MRQTPSLHNIPFIPTYPPLPLLTPNARRSPLPKHPPLQIPRPLRSLSHPPILLRSTATPISQTRSLELLRTTPDVQHQQILRLTLQQRKISTLLSISTRPALLTPLLPAHLQKRQAAETASVALGIQARGHHPRLAALALAVAPRAPASV